MDLKEIKDGSQKEQTFNGSRFLPAVDGKHRRKQLTERRIAFFYCFTYNFFGGEVAEWSMATVLKTVNPARGSRVRISPSPPGKNNVQKFDIFLISD